MTAHDLALATLAEQPAFDAVLVQRVTNAVMREAEQVCGGFAGGVSKMQRRQLRQEQRRLRRAALVAAGYHHPLLWLALTVIPLFAPPGVKVALFVVKLLLYPSESP